MDAKLALHYGDKTFHAAFDDLPQAQWTQGGVCGVWSVKDIIGHVSVMEMLVGEVLQSFLGGGENPMMQAMGQLGPAAFNDQQADLRKDWPSQKVLDEYQEAFSRTQELAEEISPEKFREVGTLPWYGAEYALDDLIMYMNYAHKREHAAQINVFKDSLAN